jgi:hypothetical protein
MGLDSSISWRIFRESESTAPRSSPLYRPRNSPRITILGDNMTIYPSSGLNPKIPAFLTKFYRISDDVNGEEEYLLLFTPDASFKFTSIQMSGTEGQAFSTQNSDGRNQKVEGNLLAGQCAP